MKEVHRMLEGQGSKDPVSSDQVPGSFSRLTQHVRNFSGFPAWGQWLFCPGLPSFLTFQIIAIQ